MSNDITFVKQQGGLGRPLAGSDHISGLLFYSGATLPTGFTASDRIKKVFSIEEAEDLGITDASLGETKAVAKVLIAGTPAIGDTLTITYTGINGAVTVLNGYALVSGEETTATTAAAAWKAQINAGTGTHGFTADNTTGSLFVTTKAGEGIFPNTGTPYAVTVTGGSTATLTQPTGSGSTVLGVASDIDIMHYHISEFFRIQPKGVLYVGIYATSDATTFASITLMQNYALGTIRQIGVYQKTTTFATSQCTTLQSIVAANTTAHKPLEVIYQPEMAASVIATLSDLRTLNAPNVSVTFGQDGANTGYKLYNATGKSIGCLGTTLGAVALAKVSEDIAWVGKFNLSNVEYDTLAYANGALYSAQTTGAIDNINALGYIALVKHVDIEGSYFNDSHTAVALTSDFAYIEPNRTFNKAIRNLRTFLMPQLASPIDVNADGTLTEGLIGYYEALCARALDVMQRDGEISAYDVIIDPTQDVLSTSTLTICVKLVPKGVARQIVVNVGFTLSV
jgi:hypothetical protein